MKIYAYAMVDFVVATLAARPSARVAQPIIERGGVSISSGTPRQAWLNYHDERNMNHKQTEK